MHFAFKSSFSAGVLKKAAVYTGLFLLFPGLLYSQISISGSSCVTAGSTNAFNISGNWNTGMQMTWTSSGNITGSSSGTPLPQVQIIFNTSGFVKVQTFDNVNGTQTYTLNVTVAGPVSIGAISPSSQTIDYGHNPVVTGGAPSGGACNANYQYQWQISYDNSSWSDVSGATAQNLSYTSGITQTTYFREKLTDITGGTSAISNTATVLTYPPLSGGNIGPSTQNLYTGSTPGSLGGSDASGGRCICYTYAWQTSADGVNFTTVASGSGYQPPANAGLAYYRRQVTDADGEIAYSNVVTVNIEPHLAAGTLNQSNITISPGADPGTLTSTQPTGDFCTPSAYVYQWERSADGTHFTNISGANGLSFDPGPVSVTTDYRLVTKCGSDSVTSLCIVNVNVITGAITPSTQQLNYGGNSVQLSIPAATGGSGSYTYDWQASSDPSFTTFIDGVGSGRTYTPPPGMTATTYYRVAVTSYPAAPVYSTNYGTVNVYPQLQAGSITTASTSIVYGTSASLALSGTTGGSGTYTYQWLSNASGSFQPVGGITSSNTFSTGVLTSAVSYEVTVYNNGVSVTTAPLALTVTPSLTGGVLNPGLINIQLGTSPGYLTCSPGSCGGCNIGLTYAWQSSTDGSTWSTIAGVSSLSYNPGNLSATTYYRVEVLSGSNTNYSNVAEVFVGAVSYDLAYVRTRAISKPGVADTVTADGLTNAVDVKQVTQYVDGLGRPVQTVSRQASPLLQDMVDVQVYDPDGRESIKYLPYASPSNDGNYKNYAESEQYGFNSAQFPGEKYLYGQINFEPSPLNRTLTSYAAGNSWVGGNRGVGNQYLSNGANDSVHIWNIDTLPGSLPVDAGVYPMGQLHELVTTDEQGHQVVEYSDKTGHVVLKKVQISASPGVAHVGWLCTYYIYDDMDNLRFVISPKAVVLVDVGTTWSISQGIADELCFRYEYDARGRMYQKKIPGAGVGYMVYDGRDRLVMAQDSNLRRSGQWLVTQYDGLDRQIETGLITYSASQSVLQQLVTNQTGGSGAASGFSVDTTLTAPNETGSVGVTGWIEMDSGFSTLNGGTFTGEIVNGAWGGGGSTSGTDVVSLSPVPSGVALQPLTFTYYDDYAWLSGSGTALSAASFAGAIAGSGGYFITSYNAAPTYSVAVSPDLITRGQVTGTQTLVMGTDGQFISTVNYYDDHVRVIQSQTINSTGGVDTTTVQYDFSGKPLRALVCQAKPGNGAQFHRVLTKTSYDPNFRVTSVWKNIDGAAADQLIDSMQYNEIGQLRTKNLGRDPVSGAPLDSLVYDYNIRGWLTGINKNYVAGTTQHYFGMELGYDNPASIAGTSYNLPQYNGNIAGVIWKSGGDGVRRKYDFGYDEVNRLVEADYLDNHTGTGWDASAMDYSVSGLTYDANGNILSMIQKGFKIGNPTGVIDSLTYGYVANSNKLLQVHDGANDAASVLGDFHYKGNKGAFDYAYDGNGSLLLDNNKAIDTIVYNYLNLPQQVHFKGKGSIFYQYDAAGGKLQKQTIDSAAGIATTTLYLDGFQYQRRTSLTNTTGGTDTLQFLGHEEGRARWAFHKHLAGDSAYSWEYDFYEKDHLGDTRVLLSQEKDTAQYVATMEARYRATEDALFYGIDSTSFARSAVMGYPDDLTVTNPNDSVARVNGNGPKVGPAIILKVMAGDKVDMGVQYYYNSMTNNNGPALQPKDLLNSLASGLAMLSAPAHGALSTLSDKSSSPLLAALTSSVDSQDASGSGKPQAYLNWVLLDNQFNYVGGNNQSGALQVGAAGTQSNGQLQPQLAYTGLPISKSGYLYIYVSNATPGWDVFFDNLSVKHYSGPMVEEDHYYPFGLTMAGISDEAVKTQYAENKYRFQKQGLQNKEFSDESGLEMYEFKYRFDDPQIGRFWSVDPLATKYLYNSPYAFSEDKVTSHVETEGLEATPLPDLWGAVKNEFHSLAHMFSPIDRPSVGGQVQAEVPITPNAGSGTSGVITTTKTAEAYTNFEKYLNYVTDHNTNAGNPTPLITVKATTEVTIGVKTEVTTPVGSASTSVDVNKDGVRTVTGTVEVKIRPPLSIGASRSVSSDGTTKTGGNLSASTSVGTKVSSGFMIVTDSETGYLEFNVGVEQKVGNAKVSGSLFVRFGDH